MAKSIHEIAYDVSLESIRQQHQALTNLRTRAAAVVAASALVASLLGARALDAKSNDWVVAVGLAALVTVLVAAGVAMWPYGFDFRLSARTLLDDHARTQSPTEIDRFHAFLAVTLEAHHDANERIIYRLHQALQVALVAIGVETISFLAALRSF